MKREPWYKFFASEALELSEGLDAKDGFKFFRQTCLALVRGETGRTTLADSMLARYEEDAEKNRRNALKRGHSDRIALADKTEEPKIEEKEILDPKTEEPKRFRGMLTGRVAP